MSGYDELVVGAIDLHCHVDVEFSRSAFRKFEPEWVWLPKAEALGMRGVVLKSHWWPTVVAAPFLQALYPGPVEVWSSITLNPASGGPELWAVETAAAMGARVVFMPTWSARRDLENEGFHARLAQTFATFEPSRFSGYACVDEAGRLAGWARDLLRYCHAHDLTLGSGHHAGEEVVALAEEARAMGYERLIFSHPLSRSVRAPLEVARQAAELGAWVEVCGNNFAPGRMLPTEVVEWIRAVGVERVVLSTDYFTAPKASPPEELRAMLGTLLEAGLTREEIRQMVAVNPARALGVAPPEG